MAGLSSWPVLVAMSRVRGIDKKIKDKQMLLALLISREETGCLSFLQAHNCDATSSLRICGYEMEEHLLRLTIDDSISRTLQHIITPNHGFFSNRFLRFFSDFSDLGLHMAFRFIATPPAASDVLGAK